MPPTDTLPAPAPTSTSQTPRRGLLDPSIYDKILTDQDKKPVTLKLKRAIPVQSQPGNWLDTKILNADKDDKLTNGENAVLSAAASIVNSIDPRIAAAFPNGRPMMDQSEPVSCKHCKKPVLKIAAASHIKECLRKKQEKMQKKKEAKDAAMRKGRNNGLSPDPELEDGDRKITGRKTALAEDGSDLKSKSGKKRKAEDGSLLDGASAKKKKKDDLKSKAAKPKGPVDVEKQCGVPLANGMLCARSLTCKSHSMGAKRAVPGRSLPYDMLLAQYQKKNQAKQQRAAIDASAAMADELLEPPGTIDSDEERDAVMASFTRAFRPNAFTGSRVAAPSLFSSGPMIPARSKYKMVRIKEMLNHALGGVKGANLFATPATLMAQQTPLQSALPPGPSSDDLMGSHSRRPSMTMGRPGSLHPGSRKASMSGAVAAA